MPRPRNPVAGLPFATGGRPRQSVLLPLLGAIVLLAWFSLWWLEQTNYYLLFHDHGGGHHAQHAGLPGWLTAATFVIGWLLMTVAMMLPTTIPLVANFQRMVARRAQSGRLVTLLLLGYLGAWLGFGFIALGLIWAIDRLAALVDVPAQRAWTTGTALFLLAGAFQFSSLKYACLDKCRAPTGFLMSHWRGRNPQLESMNIGWQHGVFCVGCCWALMLLMFAVSTASLAWMLVLAVIMATEKNLPWGRRLGRPLGAVLLATGLGLGVYNLA